MIFNQIVEIIEYVDIIQIFPYINDQYLYNDTVQELKENIQSFNFNADMYAENYKSVLPGDLVNQKVIQEKKYMSTDIYRAVMNLHDANNLIKDRLISNEHGLFSDDSINRWIGIYNKNGADINSIVDQYEAHVAKNNELREIHDHLVNFVPVDKHQRVGTSMLNDRNFVYLDYKNTQKTRNLFKYIVTRLKSVNKLVNRVATKLKD